MTSHLGLPRRRGRRRRRVGGFLVILVALAVVAGTALYGWHRLFHHVLGADSCQVVDPTTATVYPMDPTQLLNASIIADVAMRRGLPQRAVIVALATAQQESKLYNLDYGDRDSLGLFQQRPSQGWGTAAQISQPTYAAGAFYTALLKVPNWQGISVGDAAQAVQRSEFPDAYASWAPRASALAGALTGTTSGRLTCRLVHPGVDTAAGSPVAASPITSSDAGSAAASPTPSPTSVEQASAALTAQLAADLSILHPAVASTGDAATVTLSGLGSVGSGGDAAAEHRDVTVAAWAVAHAAPYGVTSVVVGDQEWRPNRLGWQAARTAAPGGSVVVTLARR